MSSLIDPSVTDLLKRVDNRYRLVTLTSKRARQIIDGQEPLVPITSVNPLSIAVNEVNQGLIEYETLKDGVK
ncbi:DNA-directed RNA polymerase subunit omega [Proteiniclasticum sp. BAD-10]|uniref:DNA-directed RNA polymerase subunit omega n=1 Tax=Proteiniclasticum sediminis TaxID=2804028 RepID=A0A941HQF5_9CLOT|nr:DNA-directed RNA polymerase subunit omega [Proteiniclasticum sediminis]MBR0575428.1 DNA-directed RNA polymerase subunit omega [Proteiniclasticum sediminis]